MTVTVAFIGLKDGGWADAEGIDALRVLVTSAPGDLLADADCTITVDSWPLGTRRGFPEKGVPVKLKLTSVTPTAQRREGSMPRSTLSHDIPVRYAVHVRGEGGATVHLVSKRGRRAALTLLCIALPIALALATFLFTHGPLRWQTPALAALSTIGALVGVGLPVRRQIRGLTYDVLRATAFVLVTLLVWIAVHRHAFVVRNDEEVGLKLSSGGDSLVVEAQAARTTFSFELTVPLQPPNSDRFCLAPIDPDCGAPNASPLEANLLERFVGVPKYALRCRKRRWIDGAGPVGDPAAFYPMKPDCSPSPEGLLVRFAVQKAAKGAIDASGTILVRAPEWKSPPQASLDDVLRDVLRVRVVAAADSTSWLHAKATDDAIALRETTVRATDARVPLPFGHVDSFKVDLLSEEKATDLLGVLTCAKPSGGALEALTLVSSKKSSAGLAELAYRDAAGVVFSSFTPTSGLPNVAVAACLGEAAKGIRLSLVPGWDAAAAPWSLSLPGVALAAPVTIFAGGAEIGTLVCPASPTAPEIRIEALSSNASGVKSVTSETTITSVWTPKHESPRVWLCRPPGATGTLKFADDARHELDLGADRQTADVPTSMLPVICVKQDDIHHVVACGTCVDVNPDPAFAAYARANYPGRKVRACQ